MLKNAGWSLSKVTSIAVALKVITVKISPAMKKANKEFA